MTDESIDRLRLYAIHAITNRDHESARNALSRIEQLERGNLVVAGVCRFCGCTELTPCGVMGPLGTAIPCMWMDEAETVCSNLKCLSLDEAEQGPARRVVGV